MNGCHWPLLIIIDYKKILQILMTNVFKARRKSVFRLLQKWDFLLCFDDFVFRFEVLLEQLMLTNDANVFSLSSHHLKKICQFKFFPTFEYKIITYILSSVPLERLSITPRYHYSFFKWIPTINNSLNEWTNSMLTMNTSFRSILCGKIFTHQFWLVLISNEITNLFQTDLSKISFSRIEQINDFLPLEWHSQFPIEKIFQLKNGKQTHCIVWFSRSLYNSIIEIFFHLGTQGSIRMYWRRWSIWSSLFLNIYSCIYWWEVILLEKIIDHGRNSCEHWPRMLDQNTTVLSFIYFMCQIVIVEISTPRFPKKMRKRTITENQTLTTTFQNKEIKHIGYSNVGLKYFFFQFVKQLVPTFCNVNHWWTSFIFVVRSIE